MPLLWLIQTSSLWISSASSQEIWRIFFVCLFCCFHLSSPLFSEWRWMTSRLVPADRAGLFLRFVAPPPLAISGPMPPGWTAMWHAHASGLHHTARTLQPVWPNTQPESYSHGEEPCVCEGGGMEEGGREGRIIVWKSLKHKISEPLICDQKRRSTVWPRSPSECGLFCFCWGSSEKCDSAAPVELSTFTSPSRENKQQHTTFLLFEQHCVLSERSKQQKSFNLLACKITQISWCALWVTQSTIFYCFNFKFFDSLSPSLSLSSCICICSAAQLPSAQWHFCFFGLSPGAGS